MVDYSVSDAASVSKRGVPFKMEELTLSDLLECPLCLEPLDASAKVLPCQHTFCMACLQRHEATYSQLLCPECHAPVPARTVKELPANLLLVRLLEGLQGPGRDRQTSHYAVPLVRGDVTLRDGQQYLESQHRERQGPNELTLRPLMRNRGDSSGDPGNGITPKHKVEESWHHGNAGDSSGVSVPAGPLQAPSQGPLQHSQPLALCRALQDFHPEQSNLEDSKYCLSFLKV